MSRQLCCHNCLSSIRASLTESSVLANHAFESSLTPYSTYSLYCPHTFQRSSGVFPIDPIVYLYYTKNFVAQYAVMQDEMAYSGSSQILYRQCIHSLHQKAAKRQKRQRRVYLTGPRGCGKTIALTSLVDWARSQGWLVSHTQHVSRVLCVILESCHGSVQPQDFSVRSTDVFGLTQIAES